MIGSFAGVSWILTHSLDQHKLRKSCFKISLTRNASMLSFCSSPHFSNKVFFLITQICNAGIKGFDKGKQNESTK